MDGNLGHLVQAPRRTPWLRRYFPSGLVHGWDRIKNLSLYSLLALSTHKNVKYYPTMTKRCPGFSGRPCLLVPENFPEEDGRQ